MARPPLFTTVLTVAVYAIIFLSVILTDELPPVSSPEEQVRRGLNLTQAWDDLHFIAARPHPYNSQANRRVRNYIWARVRNIQERYPGHVHVDLDLTSKGSWDEIYFEGENVLVKIDGLGGDEVDKEEGGVLFSAHYDSVSTSFGAIDDGIGVVSMLQMVEKIAKVRTRRSVVFNFNNGEEDGLNGAAAFLKHPWSNLTKVFMNLEGAASGGRPVLFRGTSATSLNSFHHSHVSRPHGTVLAADAFERKILRSRTDFSVYVEQGQMDGLDLAFYKGRSHYHTKFDAIPFIVGGERTLWSMMDALDGAGMALLNNDVQEESQGKETVYFDLWGRFMIMLPTSLIRSFNWTLLAGAPILILFFALQSKEPTAKKNTTGGHAWAKFWFGLLATIAGQAWLVFAYQSINRYIVYSSPYPVLVSHLCLAFVTFFITTSRQSKTGPLLDVPGLQQTYLLQLALLSYSFLAIFHFKIPIGGSYLFSALAGCAFMGWLIGAVQQDQTPTEFGEMQSNNGLWATQFVTVVFLPVLLLWHITILLIGAMPQGIVDGTPVWLVYAAFGLLSTLIVVPVTPFMPAMTVHRAYRKKMPVPYNVAFIIFALSGAYTSGLLGRIVTSTLHTDARLGFPFTRAVPMKVFFQQKIELATKWNAGSADAKPAVDIRPVTTLTGVPYYLDKFIIPSLPSARESEVHCKMDEDRKKLFRCAWPTSIAMLSTPGQGLLNAPQPSSEQSNTITLPHNEWLASSVTKISDTKLKVSLAGRNTRGCRIYFDNATVKTAVVEGGDDFPRNTNLTELRLWSRTWDRTFIVDIELESPTQEKVRGRVGCGWAEHESGMIGMPSVGESKIPAFEEVLRFFPRWATLTKLTDGLVEVWSAFEI